MRTTTLDNGLLILAEELHHAPLGAFSVWYRVGSRNEVPGITGISHWVEHMMFKGTPRFGRGALDRLVSSHGGDWNGFTTEDFTAYYEVLPREHFHLALEIEADRMANSAFDPGEVASERSVIISEREGSENHPVFWLAEAVEAAAWTVHPYRQGVIGAKCDLRAITREDLYAHYRSYYAPDNAVVIAAGDFQTEELFEEVEKAFGGIPRGAPRRPLRSVEPQQEGERRIVVRRPGPVPYLLAAYHVPQAGHPDTPALLVLSAVLAGARSPVAWRGRQMGRSSRLYRRLVRGSLAVRVDAEIALRVDPGVFQVLATARPGVETARLEQALSGELATVVKDGVAPEELAAAKRQLKAQIAYTRTGALGHVEWLGLFEMLGGIDLARRLEPAIAAVSPADTQRVASTYLKAENSTVGWFLPAGTPPAGAAAEAVGGDQDGNGSANGHESPAGCHDGSLPAGRPCWFRSPVCAGGGGWLPGPDSVVRETLASGLTVLASASPSAEYIELNVRIRAGSGWDPGELGGLAEFAARGTLHGTLAKPFEVYSETLDRMGASLSVDCGPDAALWSGSCLTGDLPAFSALVREALTEPAYDREDMERLKAEVKTRISERDQDTARLGRRLALEEAYPPGHPYGRPPLGSAESLDRIEVRDLVSFQSRRYCPQGTVVAAAGPLDPRKICRIISAQFSGWSCRGGAEADVRRPSEGAGVKSTVDARRLTPSSGPVRSRAGTRRNVELPGKTQSDVALALPAISRADPDFEGLYVLNLVFGSFGLGGRVGRRVRDQLGLAYYCYSAVVEREGHGPWLLQAGVNPGNLELALKAIREELVRIRCEPVSEQELADAVGFARGSLTLQLESPAGLVSWLTRLEAYGLGLDYLTGYPDRLARLTPERLQELAGRLLDEDRAAVVVVGPPAR